MLQHLHDHWLNGSHFNKRKTLLQQLFKLCVSKQVKTQTTVFKCLENLLQSNRNRHTPVFIFSLCDGCNSFHKFFPKLVKNRLVEFKPRRTVEVEERQSWLERWQQDAIFHLQSHTQQTNKQHLRFMPLATVTEHIHLLYDHSLKESISKKQINAIILVKGLM